MILICFGTLLLRKTIIHGPYTATASSACTGARDALLAAASAPRSSAGSSRHITRLSALEVAVAVHLKLKFLETLTFKIADFHIFCYM